MAVAVAGVGLCPGRGVPGAEAACPAPNHSPHAPFSLQVLLGVRALLADGGVLAAAGAHGVALAARRHAVPFVALVGMHQLTPLFPPDPGLAFNEFAVRGRGSQGLGRGQGLCGRPPPPPPNPHPTPLSPPQSPEDVIPYSALTDAPPPPAPAGPAPSTPGTPAAAASAVPLPPPDPASTLAAHCPLVDHVPPDLVSLLVTDAGERGAKDQRKRRGSGPRRPPRTAVKAPTPRLALTPSMKLSFPHFKPFLVLSLGCYTPSYVYRLLQEYYSRDDYALTPA